MKKLLFLLPLMILLVVSNTVEAKKKKYPNGDYYEGEWKKGQPNGIGIMKFVNGDTYEGNWVMGEKNGNGKMTYKDGDIYEGEWKKGQPNGIGIMKFVNGDTYEGNWVMGEKNDSGKMTYKDGAIYEGNWVMGEANGKGKFTDIFTNTFEGNFKNGVPIIGKLSLGIGRYCEGEFKSSNIERITSLLKSCILYNGSCEKYRRDEETFTGKILNGEYHEGKLTKSNGGWLEGKWVNGMFSDGKCDVNIEDSYYQGEWKNGNFYTGKSKGEIKDNYYDGVWINGVFQGKCWLNYSKSEEGFKTFDGVIDDSGTMDGKVEYVDNIIYRGILKNKKKEGNGTLYSSTGNMIIEGEWKDGNFIHGKGDYKYANNTYPFTINKLNDAYNIKIEIGNRIITCTQKINPDKQSSYLEMTNTLNSIEKKIEEQKENILLLKEEQERLNKEKEELRALQKEIADAKYYYWTPSEILRLYQENPAKFDDTFYGSFLGDATLIRGKIANIRREIESGLFGDDIYYNIYLEGGVVIQTYKKAVVSQIQKGQTVFMLAKYKNQTTNKYGYTQSPIFRLVTDEFIANSIDAVSKYLKEKRDTGEKVYENYYFRNLVRNIYR